MNRLSTLRKTRVYIISPYTRGNKEKNVKRSMAAADVLIRNGFAPYCPLLNHYQDLAFPQNYEVWLELDFEWLLACDVVYRLAGKSPGGDREEALARANCIPVIYDTEGDNILKFPVRVERKLNFKKDKADVIKDNVDHPAHYTFGKYEVIDVLEDWFEKNPLLWQTGKYIARAEHKGKYIEDLKKARVYLSRAIDRALEKENK